MIGEEADRFDPHEMLRARLSLWVERSAAAVADIPPSAVEGIGPGDIVLCRLPNAAHAAARFFSVLARGASAIALPEDMSWPRAKELGDRSGATASLREDLVIRLSPPKEDRTVSVFTLTSGSTGDAKIVCRSLRSHLLEAERYRRFLGLRPENRVLLPIPISHSYALGWLFGCMHAGCETALLPPTALNEISATLNDWAEIVALVPSLARLLARRERLGSTPRALSLAMVGAGPVDMELERAFHKAFGLGLARNFGSTETGAVLAGGPDTPPGFLGRPLPGVTAEVRDLETGRPATDGREGRLWVRLDGGPWHDMGDIALRRSDGLIKIVGRADHLLRRGHRLVSPQEIEAAIQATGLVADVAVVGVGKKDGNDEIAALVVPMDESNFSERDVITAARERLDAAYKMPELLIRRRALPRGTNGKLQQERRYRIACGRRLSEILQYYKLSELMFALDQLGVLELLLEGATPTEICYLKGLDWEVLKQALDALALSGVVVSNNQGPRAGEVESVLAMERDLSRHLTSRESLATRLKGGSVDGAYPAAFRPVYRRAMGGRGLQACARLVLNRLRQRKIEMQRVLEISGGDGLYLPIVKRDQPGAFIRLVRCGVFQDPDGTDRSSAAEALWAAPQPGNWQLVILSNAIRAPDLRDPVGLIRDGIDSDATVLVDDRFVVSNTEDACTAIDWMASGSCRYWRASDFTTALEDACLVYERISLPEAVAREVYLIGGCTRDGH